MAREFSIVRELSRREVERQGKRFIGITVAAPEFRDQNGLLEWVVDIRVGVVDGWAVIKDCLVAQWALGVVTDMNIPVLAERSEAGRVTIIARSEYRLADDIHVTAYNYEDLNFSFMRNLRENASSQLVDGFGLVFTEPDSDGNMVAYSPPAAEAPYVTTWNDGIVEWGGTDFEYGVTSLGKRVGYWSQEIL